MAPYIRLSLPQTIMNYKIFLNFKKIYKIFQKNRTNKFLKLSNVLKVFKATFQIQNFEIIGYDLITLLFTVLFKNNQFFTFRLKSHFQCAENKFGFDFSFSDIFRCEI